MVYFENFKMASTVDKVLPTLCPSGLPSYITKKDVVGSVLKWRRRMMDTPSRIAVHVNQCGVFIMLFILQATRNFNIYKSALDLIRHGGFLDWFDIWKALKECGVNTVLYCLDEEEYRIRNDNPFNSDVNKPHYGVLLHKGHYSMIPPGCVENCLPVQTDLFESLINLEGIIRFFENNYYPDFDVSIILNKLGKIYNSEYEKIVSSIV